MCACVCAPSPQCISCACELACRCEGRWSWPISFDFQGAFLAHSGLVSRSVPLVSVPSRFAPPQFTRDESALEKTLQGFRWCAAIASFHDLSETLNHIIISMCKYSQKCIDAMEVSVRALGLVRLRFRVPRFVHVSRRRPYPPCVSCVHALCGRSLDLCICVHPCACRRWVFRRQTSLTASSDQCLL